MNNQQKTYLWAGLGIILIIIAILVGRNSSNQLSSENSIKIGALYNLSGIGANSGQNSRQGTDMAVEEINKSGGVLGRKIEVVYEDNLGDDTKTALAAINKFEQNGIKVVIGTNWTPSGLAVAPVACQKGMVMVSPSLGVAEFNETCDFLFNLWPHDDLFSKELGSTIVQQGYKKVAIVGSLQEWEKTQAQAARQGIEAAGGAIVAFELPQEDKSEFRSEAAKIKASNPEAVVLTNYTYEGPAAKQLREIGVTAPFFSVLIDSQMIESANGALEGAVAITPFSPTFEFSKKFQTRYEGVPDLSSDTAYDAVKLITQAMEKTKSTDPVDIKNYIGSLKTHNGASGHLVFDGKGGVTKEPNFVLVKDGKTVPYEPSN